MFVMIGVTLFGLPDPKRSFSFSAPPRIRGGASLCHGVGS
jgi:hypothetical protein